MREKWDRQQSGTTYGAITVQNAVNTCRGGYDPANISGSRRRGSSCDPRGPLSLVDIAPEDNQRYGLNDIGNGNLFADWYKEKAALCRSGNNGISMTGKSGSRTRAG